MKSTAIAAFILLAVSSVTFSQQHEVVISNREPAVYNLNKLFESAETVAIVRIVSGDTEHYDSAVYKGEVVRAFKGAKKGDTLYFGPFIGHRIGWEYVLFLQDSKQPLAPKAEPSPYGTVTYRKVFDEGYSSMETSYECVFGGSNGCDYAVRVCTDYIKLPKDTSTYPPIAENAEFGCRWVRKSVFVRMLERLSSSAPTR